MTLLTELPLEDFRTLAHHLRGGDVPRKRLLEALAAVNNHALFRCLHAGDHGDRDTGQGACGEEELLRQVDRACGEHGENKASTVLWRAVLLATCGMIGRLYSPAIVMPAPPPPLREPPPAPPVAPLVTPPVAEETAPRRGKK